MDKLFSKKDLLQAMKDAGLPHSTMWLRYAEQRGLIISPRLPNNRGDRAFTKEQIDQIVQAFSPNGEGKWV
jgi:hypothetical protein